MCGTHEKFNIVDCLLFSEAGTESLTNSLIPQNSSKSNIRKSSHTSHWQNLSSLALQPIAAGVITF